MTDTVDAEVPLPELHQAELDPETLADLFCDLAALGEIVEIRLKRPSTNRAEQGTVTLSSARAALLSGDAIGAQIVYGYNGGHWIDTLMTVAPARVLVTRLQCG